MKQSKACGTCHEDKPLSDYHKDKTHNDGVRSVCKSCVSRRDAAWRAANRDHINQLQLEYRRANADAIKEGIRRWKKANKAHVKEVDAKWHASNREREAKRLAKWAVEHPDHMTARDHKHRAKERGSYGSFSADEWRDLKAEYDYRCLRCGAKEPDIKLTVDHVIPLDKGGTNYIDNIQPLCLSCNSGKRDRHIDYRYQRTEATG